MLGAMAFRAVLQYSSIVIDFFATAAHSRGIGTRMIEEITYLIRRNGVKYCILGSTPKAKKFYMHRGFWRLQDAVEEFREPEGILDEFPRSVRSVGSVRRPLDIEEDAEVPVLIWIA